MQAQRIVKVLAGTPKHLGISGKQEKGRIDYLMLNLPFRCNYRCIMCCNGKEKKDGWQTGERKKMGRLEKAGEEKKLDLEKERAGKKGNKPNTISDALSFSEIERVLAEAKELGARVLVVAGEGEPFLIRETKGVVSHAHALGMASIVFTNASFPLDGKEGEVERTAQFLLEKNASVIASFHGFTPETYERIAGRKESFERAKRNLEILRDVFRTSVKHEEGRVVVRLAVNFVLNKLNEGELEEAKRFCGEDVMFVCNHTMPSGSALGEWGELVGTREEYERMKQIAARESENNGLSGLSVDETRCGYWARGVSVGSNGSILTCAYAGETKEAFGNVREEKLEELKRKVDESVEKFEEKHGAHFCIKRHEQFQEYVQLVGKAKNEE